MHIIDMIKSFDYVFIFCIIGEIRGEQNDPEFLKEKKILQDRNEKMYHVAGVDVSATEAEESIKAMDLNHLPKIYKQPFTEEELQRREREAFERRFGVNFDEAVDDLLEQDRKSKKNIPDQPKRTTLGPFEGLVLTHH